MKELSYSICQNPECLASIPEGEDFCDERCEAEARLREDADRNNRYFYLTHAEEVEFQKAMDRMEMHVQRANRETARIEAINRKLGWIR